MLIYLCFYSLRTGWSKLSLIRDGHDVYFLHHRSLYACCRYLFHTRLANARRNYERAFSDILFLLVVSEKIVNAHVKNYMALE